MKSDCPHKLLRKQLSGMQVWYVCGDKWIPVDKSLPKPGTKVMVSRSTLPHIDFAWYMTGSGGYRAFYNDGEEDTKVTHWMPLPSPPNKPCGQKFKAVETDGRIVAKRSGN